MKNVNIIRTLATQVTVLSEVGSKDEAKIIPPYKWIQLMKAELQAGAWKVIGEAREGGTVGPVSLPVVKYARDLLKKF